MIITNTLIVLLTGLLVRQFWLNHQLSQQLRDEQTCCARQSYRIRQLTEARDKARAELLSLKNKTGRDLLALS